MDEVAHYSLELLFEEGHPDPQIAHGRRQVATRVGLFQRRHATAAVKGDKDHESVIHSGEWEGILSWKITLKVERRRHYAYSGSEPIFNRSKN